ncbi:hypothetical protein MSAN_01076200 [Mycena sanguinolenta]|uniref:Uncharacterized protein n=1 Tax=Mycena sanguinolenta TaxID=230812 RepID=A0A8H6YS52_9AGAR|nr:hypothetical protein MSAN_01076200 [Mycena sanguinolenta]
MHVLPSALRVGINLPKGIVFRIPTSHYGIRTQGDKPRHAVGRPQHLLSTLNSSRLTPSDYLDLSKRDGITVRFPNSPYVRDTPKGKLRYQSVDQHIPFPAQASGFLYYYRDPDAAPLEGSIRFRITPDRSPSSFALGHDLILPSGMPWQVLLIQIACTTQYLRIRDHLLEEKLITEDQLARCNALGIDRRRTIPAATLFRLNQEFALNFGRDMCLTIVGDMLQSLRWRLFRAKDKGMDYCPWVGAVPRP